MSILRRRLLRLEYWFDRLTDWRRLLVGVSAIAGLILGLLYVLGLASVVMVNRAEAADDLSVSAEGSDQGPSPPRVGLGQRRPTSTPTPATDDVASLIQPPEMQEVPIISVPRFVPVEPLKPRVVAPTATPPPPSPAPAVVQPARPGSPAPAPTSGQAGTTPTPERTSSARTPTSTRPPAVTPLLPPLQPTATPRPNSNPTATPQP
jgi:hypothetical protein